MRAELMAVEGDEVTIRRDDGKTFTVSGTTFSPEDRKFIQNWFLQNPDHFKPPQWPRKVRVTSVDVTIVQENSDGYIYRTEHFEFRSDVRLSRSLVASFGKTFEATFAAVDQLPLGLHVRPPENGFFITRLFSTVEDYHAAGGIPGSGGIYSQGNPGRILIPLKNLGVRQSSSGFSFDRHKSNHILIHEITHQVLWAWIRQLPVWFNEGIAEYLESVPYRDGIFNFQQHDIREFLLTSVRTDSIAITPLDTLLTIDSREWTELFAEDRTAVTQNYRSALLLTYYFLHLDRDKDAIRLRQYLTAIRQGISEPQASQAYLLKDRTPAELEEELIRAFSRTRISLSASPLE